MKSRARTLIIAEAGVNHNGSLRRALQLVDAAAAAGADAVKFQTFRAVALACADAPAAAYQRAAAGGGTQLQLLERLELDAAAHRALAARCRSRGVQFLSTPFDEQSLDLLVRRIRVPLLKIPSGEITNAPLLLAIARTGKPAILSTGMSTLAEVGAALAVLAYGYTQERRPPSPGAVRAVRRSPAGVQALRAKVTLLHCTSAYPAPLEAANLRAMDTLREAFGLPVGLSDHTLGSVACIAAVARGAVVLEKHFTLDRTLPGPDHRASLEPAELGSLIEAVRGVERALGTGRKAPAPAERENLPVARRSLVAARDVAKGEVFTEQNLTAKRPGTGLSPMRYWQFLGRRAKRDYRRDEQLAP
jgi:N-acetylneuraminate synthase